MVLKFDKYASIIIAIILIVYSFFFYQNFQSQVHLYLNLKITFPNALYTPFLNNILFSFNISLCFVLGFILKQKLKLELYLYVILFFVFSLIFQVLLILLSEFILDYLPQFFTSFFTLELYKIMFTLNVIYTLLVYKISKTPS